MSEQLSVVQMAKVYKALSSEQRLKLFRLIYYWNKAIPKNECCGVQKAFTRACDNMNLSRSTISHHLKELQNAGLIICNKEGQSMNCSINFGLVEQMKIYFD